MKYEVQHHTLADGWINTWSILDEESGHFVPQTFDREADANLALDMFFDDLAPDQEYSRGEFRVRPVGLPWFAVGDDGELYNVGPCDDIEAAESSAERLGVVAIWLIDPKTARNWSHLIDRGLR